MWRIAIYSREASTISRTSGPPNWLKRTAFIARFELDPGGIRPDSSSSPVGLANR
jgi:hypothetical protein